MAQETFGAIIPHVEDILDNAKRVGTDAAEQYRRTDMSGYAITLTRDDEAGVWFCMSEDIPGLILESNSVEALMERVKLAAPELLEMSGVDPHNIRLTFKAERSVVVA